MRHSPSPEERDVVVEALVAQALDDLEQGHLDLEETLRALARAAWSAARQRRADCS